MRRWLLNLIEIIIFVVIVMAFFVAVAQNLFIKDKSLFGFKTYVIASNSMYPIFEYGDVILIKEVDYDKIEVNDIITYQGVIGEFKDKVITHEVINIVYENDMAIINRSSEGNTADLCMRAETEIKAEGYQRISQSSRYFRRSPFRCAGYAGIARFA